MYLPFAVLLVPYWAGAIGEHTLMMWGHVLMFPAMALVMVLRPAEYSH
jgi:flagellar biosynthetic protein FliP